MTTRAQRIVGRGNAWRPGCRRIVISFDDETFEEIRQRAISEGTSFAEQVRTLVDWGMESAQ